MNVTFYSRLGMKLFACPHAKLGKLSVIESALYCTPQTQALTTEDKTMTYKKARYDKAITMASNVRALRDAFSKLTSGTDLTYEQLANSVLHTASEQAILESANLSIALGLPIEKLPELFNDAMRLGFAMGIDTESAIRALAIGVGRQSRLVLDNIGITLKAQDAYKKYPNIDKVDAWKRYALDLIREKAKLLPQPDKTKVAKLQHEAKVKNEHIKLGEQLLVAIK